MEASVGAVDLGSRNWRRDGVSFYVMVFVGMQFMVRWTGGRGGWGMRRLGWMPPMVGKKLEEILAETVKASIRVVLRFIKLLNE